MDDMAELLFAIGGNVNYYRSLAGVCMKKSGEGEEKGGDYWSLPLQTG
jgi:hypothetical protein